MGFDAFWRRATRAAPTNLPTKRTGALLAPAPLVWAALLLAAGAAWTVLVGLLLAAKLVGDAALAQDGPAVGAVVVVAGIAGVARRRTRT